MSKVNKNKGYEKYEWGVMKNIKYKIEQYNLIITRTCKGRTLVIVEQREYNEEIVEFITSNGLIVAKSDPMKTCQSNKKKAFN
jgi:hypothetical protein